MLSNTACDAAWLLSSAALLLYTKSFLTRRKSLSGQSSHARFDGYIMRPI